jgi:predicted ATPase
MRVTKVYIEDFKNLKQFTVDLDETKVHTVLLGENAAGKSNLLEALVIIFRDLDLEQPTDFDYEIEYICKSNYIKVKSVSGKVQFFKGQKVGDKIFYNNSISKTAVRKNRDEYLPKYVFAYYSGVSNRLLEHFDVHQRRFYEELLKGNDKPQRPLFYARLIHSHFVLMAFYAFGRADVNEFLEEYLDIVGLESVLFVLKKPNWAKSKSEILDFWGSGGVVREFLDDVWEAALAPITHEESIREDFRRTHKQEQLYLYISNQEKLEKIAEKYGNNANFFKRLESTYISDLIQEVRVKVKKRNTFGDITFKELSEGEQQLLTVLGLIRFTREEEALILLDEPDTHLNPLWKWRYMNLLEKYSDRDETSQIIMTTHDPLVIGGMTKEEIRVFYATMEKDENGNEFKRIKTLQPDFDPKGLGVAGILTSEFFNLPSTLDEDTLELFKERDVLVSKQDTEEDLTEDEQERLHELFIQLSNLGINTTHRDPMYQKFIQALSQREEFKVTKVSKEDRVKQNKMALDLLNKLFEENEV